MSHYRYTVQCIGDPVPFEVENFVEGRKWVVIYLLKLVTQRYLEEDDMTAIAHTLHQVRSVLDWGESAATPELWSWRIVSSQDGLLVTLTREPVVPPWPTR